MFMGANRMRKEFAIKCDENDECAVIILPEEVIVANSGEFKKTIQELFNKGYYRISLDCRNLKMFDTAAVSAVTVFQQKLKEYNGEIKFINVVHDYMKHYFRTLELDKIITIEEV